LPLPLSLVPERFSRGRRPRPCSFGASRPWRLSRRRWWCAVRNLSVHGRLRLRWPDRSGTLLLW